MKLLDRYLMAQFARNLALVLCSLISIYLLVDFFDRVDNFIEARQSMGLAGKYLLFKLPFIYMQLIPVCLLLAGIITLGVLNRHFEFMALMAAGISLTRIIRPLLLAAIFFTLLTLAIGQWLLPGTNTAFHRIWYEEVNKQIPLGIFREGRTYFRGREGIFSFVRPDPAKNEFRNFSLATFDPERGLTSLINAESATWEDGVWELKKGQEKKLNAQGNFSVSLFNTLRPQFNERPDDFFIPPYKIEELSYSTLLRQAREEKGGHQEFLAELHRRLSYAFLGIPLLLLGLPVLLAVHRARSRDLAWAIPISCGMAFAAWGAWSAGQSLVKSALLPPLAASWSVHLFALLLGCLLIRRQQGRP